MLHSLETHGRNLLVASFLPCVIAGAFESLITKLRRGDTPGKIPRRDVLFAAIPYLHRWQHNSKNVARHFDVDAVPSALGKFAALFWQRPTGTGVLGKLVAPSIRKGL